METKTRVRVYEQDIYKLWGNDYSVADKLKELGFEVVNSSYDAYGPIYFIEIVPTDIKLPTWAQYY